MGRNFPANSSDIELDILETCFRLRPSFPDLLNNSDYKTITLDYPLAAAKAFASLNPRFNFVYVSGEGVC